MIKSNVAILWDWQNVRASAKEQIEKLISFAQTIGTVSYKNVYAHWRCEKAKWEELFDNLSFRCSNAPASKSNKNNADRKLIADCEQFIVNDPSIKTVILVSEDGDFKTLVRKLKQAGKEVIVIAQCLEKANRKLVQLASKAYRLNQLP
ncbi:NYN domain-containing protein [Microcoleus sp. FACHB-1515]|uniref:NYN domain-containing protein n=1 Tax=Cyanophyceae TaxID=3028117 RepID=UPI0016887E45|nr:NYN domain-containing protein [Microcoleus sp. FACHB-1515]MBD2090945.1 NYN domain-containing protein [Microcoleus sp. FACHB-1515]